MLKEKGMTSNTFNNVRGTIRKEDNRDKRLMLEGHAFSSSQVSPHDKQGEVGCAEICERIRELKTELESERVRHEMQRQKELKKVSASHEKEMKKIGIAFLEYKNTEGCSCCRDIDGHNIAIKKIAKLLNVPKYKDGSGFDFNSVFGGKKKLVQERIDEVNQGKVISTKELKERVFGGEKK